MNPNDPNVAMLELVADRLGEGLREQLVFVGGAVAGLLITDPAQSAIRPTADVDLIVQAAVRGDYQRVEQALREGLVEECRCLDEELKDYLRDWMRRLLATPAFLEALAGHLPGDAANQARLPDLVDRLHLLANLD